MESRSGLFPFITFTLIAISHGKRRTTNAPGSRGPRSRGQTQPCGLWRDACALRGGRSPQMLVPIHESYC